MRDEMGLLPELNELAHALTVGESSVDQSTVGRWKSIEKLLAGDPGIPFGVSQQAYAIGVEVLLRAGSYGAAKRLLDRQRDDARYAALPAWERNAWDVIYGRTLIMSGHPRTGIKMWLAVIENHGKSERGVVVALCSALQDCLGGGLLAKNEGMVQLLLDRLHARVPRFPSLKADDPAGLERFLDERFPKP